ncbi:hypothetical protein GXW83_03655 [Streptacidiphilus sp. PB12-B1b]|uniref:hypothetical protein n=1 Tax=Streptacidiphilus sp. PB12-B1b TaxID=2705012 RepID=UPI0015FC53B6|nr:hypothetical protein [Streptacidiphilus sp. PB12-B1b]QMU74992.1 hypothetical protein GXW83_03655 [Streptacidiphilus sp. PB12-B1b]
MSPHSDRLQQLADRDRITIYLAEHRHYPDGWAVTLVEGWPSGRDDAARMPLNATYPMPYLSSRTEQPRVGEVLAYFLDLAAQAEGRDRNPQLPLRLLSAARDDMRQLLGERYAEYLQAAGRSSSGSAVRR